jgi:hypothetical protein
MPGKINVAVRNMPPDEIDPARHIPLGRRALRVLGRRDDEADKPPALVVEDLPPSKS